jgi:hypothetical protein
VEPIAIGSTQTTTAGVASRGVVATTRGILYTLARLMGDVNVGKRIGRRFVGKMTGRGIGRPLSASN